MKENLLSAIKAHDFTAIRNICFVLSKEEQKELKSYFSTKIEFKMQNYKK